MTLLALPPPEPATAAPPIPTEVRAAEPRVITSAVVLKGFYLIDRAQQEPVEFPEPDNPAGIDYDRWASQLTVAPRSAFADSLDDLDLFED